jgi:hypothetical protein
LNAFIEWARDIEIVDLGDISKQGFHCFEPHLVFHTDVLFKELFNLIP